MLPKNNTNTFNVTIDMPEGTALEGTDRVARLAGDLLRAHPQVENYETTVGESGVIDFILDYRKSGHGRDEAVLQAGVTRLRPILLTALAIILGTFIMMFDPVFGGLAVSLIFGTFASTVLTLYVIPLLYFLWARREAGG